MENIQAIHLPQLVHLDNLTIKATKGGRDAHMSIITDHFKRYAQDLVTSLQTARCTALSLWDQSVVHYGLPESVNSDEGQNFEIELISELSKVAKLWKLCTHLYHPQTNGQCEWFNHALINIQGTLHKASSCRDMVLTLVDAHNCTRSTDTGFSP